MANKLVLKSIKELLQYDFFIPSYQRGYRWVDTQVTQLIEDIWEFTKKTQKAESEFYCLQPIVVKRRGQDWEVIDGQQRLTTIYIIFKYFEDLCKMIDPNFKPFTIEYSRRENDSFYMDSLKVDDKSYSDDIDYYFMREAFLTVKDWFDQRPEIKIPFISALLYYQEKNGVDVASNIRVIWYEIADDEEVDSIDVFTRLNIGKIPLTNAELIKAVLLQRSNFSDATKSLKQIQISTEWDNIEKTLQDDSFWYFIYNTNNIFKYENRIEYIFDLMKERSKESEKHYTFNKFYTSLIEDKCSVENIWLDVKQFFLMLDEWYRDYVLFHYIGFLVECGVSINDIKKESQRRPKKDFKEVYLVDEIKKQVKCNIEELTYGDKRIKRVLLLFNIQTVLETQKSDMRFPFHKYKSEDKSESWDIEHVCSQKDKNITESKRVDWIDDIFEYFTGQIKIDVVEKYLEAIVDDDGRVEILTKLLTLKDNGAKDANEFYECYKLVGRYFKEDEQKEQRDDISNLALLDAKTNRSYGNSFFPIKRRRIIENDKQGIFVPIATKNLFLKYYSTQCADIMYWKEDDAKNYLSAMKQVLKPFIPTQNNDTNEQ